MKHFFILSLMLCTSVVLGQATMTVDKTKIRFGDQLQATVQILSLNGGTWINRDDLWPDTIAGIEVVNGPTVSDGDDAGINATFTLAFFDTGYVRIPPLPILVQQTNRVDTLYTEDIPIQVEAVEPDSTGLLPIRDIYREPFRLGYYKRYIPHLLFLLLGIGVLYYAWKKRKRTQPVAEPAPLPPAAHEWALQALDELAAQGLWQHGEIKAHYSGLTNIFREYLERRYSIHAMEQTTDEIVDQLKTKLPHKNLVDDMTGLLSIADLIKFAKADPGTDIHAQTIERVRTFVRQTASSVNTTPSTSQPGTDEDLG